MRQIFDNPFASEANSLRTSGPVPLWDAGQGWSFSFRTTVGSTSTVTVQLSNSDTSTPAAIAEAAWSTWTIIGVAALSGATFRNAPHPARYIRFLRSDASQVIELTRVPNYT